MEDENRDFVDKHVKQVRMSKKTGRQIDHVAFQQNLHEIAKEKIKNRKKKGFGIKK